MVNRSRYSDRTDLPETLDPSELHDIDEIYARYARAGGNGITSSTDAAHADVDHYLERQGYHKVTAVR